MFSALIYLSAPRAAKSRHSDLKAAGADVRCLPFADKTFDVIISNSTLDHLETIDEINDGLQELYRVLNVGGHLLLTLDNRANPMIALRSIIPFRLLNRLGIVPYYVGPTCGPSRLRSALKEAGFEVLEVSAVLHCPRVLAVAVCNILERWTGPKVQAAFLPLLMSFERLSLLPTRFLTGHYVAVKARRPDE